MEPRSSGSGEPSARPVLSGVADTKRTVPAADAVAATSKSAKIGAELMVDDIAGLLPDHEGNAWELRGPQWNMEKRAGWVKPKPIRQMTIAPGALLLRPRLSVDS